jgi:DNA-binding winged helix-turn-helix (wHTH) protein
MNVEMLRWPSDQRRLAELREQRVPRLLVVAEEHDPPLLSDCLEDWVAVVAPEREVDARKRALMLRAEQHGTRPLLDGDGLLHHHDVWVSLSPVEQALAAAFLDRFGAVVTRETLSDRAWPAGAPTRNALDVHVLRLRRRIAPLGLEIRTVRSRGYLMQSAENVPTNGAEPNGHGNGSATRR